LKKEELLEDLIKDNTVFISGLLKANIEIIDDDSFKLSIQPYESELISFHDSFEDAYEEYDKKLKGYYGTQ